MQEATKTFEALLRLPQCVEVEPDKGCKKALLNLCNGLVVQLPGNAQSGFTLMGNSGGPKTKLGSDCLILAVVPRVIEIKGETDTVKMLANDDLTAVLDTWKAQAKLLFGGDR